VHKHARFVPVTNRGFRQRSKMYTNVIASNRGSAAVAPLKGFSTIADGADEHAFMNLTTDSVFA
jgi:hypothetical protein